MFEQEPNRIVNVTWAGLRLSQSMRWRAPPHPPNWCRVKHTSYVNSYTAATAS